MCFVVEIQNLDNESK